jgi:hypothetical protein
VKICLYVQWCLEDDHLTFRGVYVFTRTKHFGSVAIIRQPVSPTARWSNSPIVRQFDSPTETCLFFNFTFQVRTAVVYRSRIALLTPMLNHFSLLNSVSRDAALTSVSIDNDEFHVICIPSWPQAIIGVFLSLGIAFVCTAVYQYVVFHN